MCKLGTTVGILYRIAAKMKYEQQQSCPIANASGYLLSSLHIIKVLKQSPMESSKYFSDDVLKSGHLPSILTAIYELLEKAEGRSEWDRVVQSELM